MKYEVGNMSNHNVEYKEETLLAPFLPTSTPLSPGDLSPSDLSPLSDAGRDFRPQQVGIR